MSRKPARSTLEDVSPARNARVRGDADSFNRHLMDLMEASQPVSYTHLTLPTILRV